MYFKAPSWRSRRAEIDSLARVQNELLAVVQSEEFLALPGACTLRCVRLNRAAIVDWRVRLQHRSIRSQGSNSLTTTRPSGKLEYSCYSWLFIVCECKTIQCGKSLPRTFERLWWSRQRTTLRLPAHLAPLDWPQLFG